MADTITPPTLSDIQAARKRISPHAHSTPTFTSSKVNDRANADIVFKCENFQRVGAFKFRGACNAVLSLSDEDCTRGVATHSSGNHAQALALSARIKGIPAFVVMPENAPKVKVEAVKNYGAKVTFCEASLDARESTLAGIIEQTGSTMIHPYNDSRIIAGQGTAAFELLESHPDLDMVLTPVGGGGLLSGTSLSAKGLKPGITVIGTEPELADDAYHSFKTGKLVKAYGTQTIADGLRTSLGPIPFSIIQSYVDDIVTVSESAIVESMRFIWERMNMIIEASSAVPIAALFENKIDVQGKKIGIIISGGNVDFDNLPW